MNLFEATNYFLGEDDNVEDYGMNHRPPGPDGGAPLYDVTGGGDFYPDDVYSTKAFQYYGTGDDLSDRQSLAVIHSVHNKPNAIVTIYRAVPKEISNVERIRKIERDMANYMRRKTIPSGYDVPSGEKWYDWVGTELTRLKNDPEIESKDISTINNGDWVTLSRNYAKGHGESSLEGKYRILSKKVKANELYTNGDSLNEFGYWKKAK